MSITDFLEARIAEDEAECKPMAALDDDDRGGWAITYAQRVLAECAAKRAIIAEHPLDQDGFCYDSVTHQRGCKWQWPCPTIRALAASYKDHPDYQQDPA